MNGEKKVIVSLSLDPVLLREIDRKRELVPRSAFIENELRKSFKFVRTKKDILVLCKDLESILDLSRIPRKIASAASVQTTVRAGRKKVNEIKLLVEKAI